MIVHTVTCDQCREPIAGERDLGAARLIALNMGAENRDGRDVCLPCRLAEEDDL